MFLGWKFNHYERPCNKKITQKSFIVFVVREIGYKTLIENRANF